MGRCRNNRWPPENLAIYRLTAAQPGRHYVRLAKYRSVSQRTKIISGCATIGGRQPPSRAHAGFERDMAHGQPSSTVNKRHAGGNETDD